MTRFATPAYVTPEKRDMHDMLTLACREFKARGGRVTSPKRHKRYMQLREVFGAEG